MRVAIVLLGLLSSWTTAVLLVDYKGGQPVDTFGQCQLEGQNLNDHIPCPGNSSIYIKPGSDSAGKAALHYHRDAHFRRAEVRAGAEDTWKGGKTYFAGYYLKLTNTRNSLAIFQWKRDDKTVAPQDNIPFELIFGGSGLQLMVTTPGSTGSDRHLLAETPFSANEEHHIALAWDTKQNGGSVVSQNNRLAFWVDGKKIFDESKYSLWSTKTTTYPKFGIYRAEDDHSYSDGNPSEYVFNSYVYRAQISDLGFSGITESSGLPADTK